MRSRDRYNWAFPPKYLPRPGFASVAQHVPGPEDGEPADDYAARLFRMGYRESDARALAGLPQLDA